MMMMMMMMMIDVRFLLFGCFLGYFGISPRTTVNFCYMMSTVCEQSCLASPLLCRVALTVLQAMLQHLQAFGHPLAQQNLAHGHSRDAKK